MLARKLALPFLFQRKMVCHDTCVDATRNPNAYSIADMYAELALLQLYIKEGEVELPHAVEEDEELHRKKLSLLKLEVYVLCAQCYN